MLQLPPRSTTTEATDAKVAVFTCSVDSAQTETKGTTVLKSADELLNYNKSEEEIMENVCFMWKNEFFGTKEKK